MALQPPPKPASMTLNLAPMVDVMMCLIIFFLLASKLADELHVELPFAIAAQEVKEGELGNRVSITVRQADAKAPVEYVVRDWNGKEIIDRVLAPSDIAGLLQARQTQALHEGLTLSCVIRADQTVKYEDVEVVLRGCGLAHIQKIVFSVRAGEEPEGGA